MDYLKINTDGPRSPDVFIGLYLLHKSRPRDFFIQSLRDVTSQWSDGKQKLFKPVSQIRLCELFSFLWDSSVCYALSLFVLIKKNIKQERLLFWKFITKPVCFQIGYKRHISHILRKIDM